ncbi:hypothetical protein LZ554_004193 [Drepanopeziza brunnea f. sp. 'monogermtubi']|nr:hypothetical protein LZ554_004193 [Drepanopeziza brunnea f. sp. 'monogermtubi']
MPSRSWNLAGTGKEAIKLDLDLNLNHPFAAMAEYASLHLFPFSGFPLMAAMTPRLYPLRSAFNYIGLSPLDHNKTYSNPDTKPLSLYWEPAWLSLVWVVDEQLPAGRGVRSIVIRNIAAGYFEASDPLPLVLRDWGT